MPPLDPSSVAGRRRAVTDGRSLEELIAAHRIRPHGVDPPALTKIVATLGPASSDAPTIARLIEAGVGVFRLNFSHGDTESHAERVALVRAMAERMGVAIGILGDLPGPKLRVGEVIDGGIELPTGGTVVFGREPIRADGLGDPIRMSSRYDRLIDDVEVGQRVLINDGAIRMLAVDVTDDELTCTVLAGGPVSSGKGINLPDSTVSEPVLGERDLAFARWAVQHDVDYLALSFVRDASDIRELRAAVQVMAAEAGRPNLRMPIIAKIEVPQALQRIDAILETADAIMVARGDLGVEMDLARVPVIQKDLIRAARHHARPCIVATQMLESMIESPTPTRAEATDVAGAIFDGVDAVMLSGETAVGKYPVLAVEHMRRIARATEEAIASREVVGTSTNRPIEARQRIAALAHGVSVIARDLGVKLVAVWSQQGGGARHLSQLDFHVPIVAASTDVRALRQMQLLRGVMPVHMPRPEGPASFTRMIDDHVRAAGWASDGDVCVLVAGGRIGTQGVTNSLAIHCVGDPETGFLRH